MNMPLGCKKNPPDRRDFRLKAPVLKSPPAYSDLKPIVLPVENQAPLNDCVGNGGTTQGEVMWVKMGRKHEQLSRLMLYYLARDLTGDTDKDEGTYPRSMAKAFAKWGCARESLWPHDPKKVSTRPSEESYKDALNWRVKSYYWPYTNSDIKWALSKGFPVGIGIPVYDSFYYAPKGIIPMPKDDEKNNGGHWIVLCGHNDATGFFDFVNSWSTDWGSGGFGQLPYEYIEKYGWNALVMEFGENGVTPPPIPMSWFTRVVNWIKSLF